MGAVGNLGVVSAQDSFNYIKGGPMYGMPTVLMYFVVGVRFERALGLVEFGYLVSKNFLEVQ